MLKLFRQKMLQFLKVSQTKIKFLYSLEKNIVAENVISLEMLKDRM